MCATILKLNLSNNSLRKRTPAERKERREKVIYLLRQIKEVRILYSKIFTFDNVCLNINLESKLAKREIVLMRELCHIVGGYDRVHDVINNCIYDELEPTNCFDSNDDKTSARAAGKNSKYQQLSVFNQGTV